MAVSPSILDISLLALVDKLEEAIDSVVTATQEDEGQVIFYDQIKTSDREDKIIHELHLRYTDAGWSAILLHFGQWSEDRDGGCMRITFKLRR